MYRKSNFAPQRNLRKLLAAAVSLSVLLAGCSSATGSKEAENRVVIYSKNNELLFRNLKTEKPQTLTGKLYAKKDESPPSSSNARQSKDGKKIYFLDQIETGFSQGEKIGESTANLYYRDSIAKEGSSKTGDEKGQKLAGNVSLYPEFEVTDKGSVLYIKEYDGGKGRLYLHNLTEEIKINNDISFFKLSGDGTTLFYLKDNELFMQDMNNSSEKVKIDSDVALMDSVTSDGKKIYYSKTDNKEKRTKMLFVYEQGKEKTKIAGDIRSVYQINSQGNIVYSKAAETQYSFKDMFEDDLKAQDQELQLPAKPDTQSYYRQVNESSSYSSYSYSRLKFDYDAYDQDMDKYKRLSDSYKKKETRDLIRRHYTENPIKADRYELYLYAEGKETKIDDNAVVQGGGATLANTGTAVLYTKSNPDALSKKKLSQINLQVSSEFDEKAMKSVVSTAAKKGIPALRTQDGTIVQLADSGDKVENVHASKDLSKIFALTDYRQDTQKGTLMEYVLENNAIKQKNKIDEDVSEIINSETYSVLAYIKNLKNSKGDLVVRKGTDKQEISDVYSMNITSDDGGQTIYCLADYTTNGEKGKLVEIKSAKTVIADDVYTFKLRDDKSLIFLKNYSLDKGRGELWHKADKEPVKLDEDVNYVLSY